MQNIDSKNVPSAESKSFQSSRMEICCRRQTILVQSKNFPKIKCHKDIRLGEEKERLVRNNTRGDSEDYQTARIALSLPGLKLFESYGRQSRSSWPIFNAWSCEGVWENLGMETAPENFAANCWLTHLHLCYHFANMNSDLSLAVYIANVLQEVVKRPIVNEDKIDFDHLAKPR